MDEDQLLDIVDEHDQIIGKDTKENKFRKELITRNVAIFIKDTSGNFVIVKRAPTKKVFPNLLDLAACGHVDLGESYEEAAKRELKEELGIQCNVAFLNKIFNEFTENNKKIKFFTGIYLGVCDDEAKLSEETALFKKMSLSELRKAVYHNPELFTPGFVKDFKEVEHLLN